MRRSLGIAILAAVLVTLISCRKPQSMASNTPLPAAEGNFTLYVSNQSFAVDPVDIRVEIDGKLVVNDDFRVGSQHTFVPFKISLSPGKHRMQIRSTRGQAELSKEFELKDHNIGVVTYWYYPKSHAEPTARKFEFHTQKGPLMID